MTPADAATLQALIEGVSNAREAASRTWGWGRLERLADDDLRARFRRQEASWSSALAEAHEATVLTAPALEAVKARAAAMRRAWSALEAAASEAGHRPLPPEVWEVPLHDGSVAALVRDEADASLVNAQGRHLRVWSLTEFANVLHALPELLTTAKVEKPGAPLPPLSRIPRGGDPIPF